MGLFEGVVAVVPTPLNEDETIDSEGIERMINFLVSHNVGLFALGSVGEEMNLTFETRVMAARKMAEVNNGRVPLLVGGGTFGVQDTLDYFKEIEDCKIDGVHIIPYDKKQSNEAVERLFLAVADRSPFPLWLYNNSTRGHSISLDIAERLKKHPNIVGGKSGGFDHRENLGFALLQDDGFEVIGAGDSQYFLMMCLGTKANTTSSASCFPEIINELDQKIASDSIQEARKKNLEVIRFMKRIPKTAYKDNGESSAELKYILSLRGICKEFCARPFRGLRDDEKLKIREVFEDYLKYLETGEIRV